MTIRSEIKYNMQIFDLTFSAFTFYNKWLLEKGS